MSPQFSTYFCVATSRTLGMTKSPAISSWQLFSIMIGPVTSAMQVILALIIFIAFSSVHHSKAWVKWLRPGSEMGWPLTRDILGHLPRINQNRPALSPLRPRRLQLAAARIDPAEAPGRCPTGKLPKKSGPTDAYHVKQTLTPMLHVYPCMVYLPTFG